MAEKLDIIINCEASEVLRQIDQLLWMPVISSMPSDYKQQYLVTILERATGRREVDIVGCDVKGFLYNSGAGYVNDSTQVVIAWQPLMQPFKGVVSL